MENEKTIPKEDLNRTRRTLILRVQSQHNEAPWEDFVQIYQGYIHAIIRKMNISIEDTEDLVQQVLLTVWNKLPQIDVTEIRRFRSWLATITRNQTIDFIRKRSRETKRLSKAQQDNTVTHLQSIQQPEMDRLAEQEWKMHLTHQALKNVEPLFSGQAIEVFRLNFGGMEIKAIAQKLDLQENSVYRLRNRVKKRLVQEIARLREEWE